MQRAVLLAVIPAVHCRRLDPDRNAVKYGLNLIAGSTYTARFLVGKTPKDDKRLQSLGTEIDDRVKQVIGSNIVANGPLFGCVDFQGADGGGKKQDAKATITFFLQRDLIDSKTNSKLNFNLVQELFADSASLKEFDKDITNQEESIKGKRFSVDNLMKALEVPGNWPEKDTPGEIAAGVLKAVL